MKCALMIPNFGLAGDARLLADLAAEVEEEGWDGFFIWDHLQWPNAEPCVDPWVALAAVAMKTTQISIGTMVTPLPRRDVAKLARETVSIDRLSQGRLIFGAGLGWQGIPEWDSFGHESSLKIRADMLDEGLDLLIALWSGNPVDHDGKYYKVRSHDVRNRRYAEKAVLRGPLGRPLWSPRWHDSSTLRSGKSALFSVGPASSSGRLGNSGDGCQ